MKPSALLLRKFRREFLLLNLIISFILLFLLLPKESFAASTQIYFDVAPPPPSSNYSVVPTDQAANLCGQPLQCANSHNIGNCQLQTCPAGGNDWTKYQLTCVQYTDPDPFNRTITYESYYQQAGRVCSIGDKYNSGNPPVMDAGFCDCTVGGGYKTCCSGTTPVPATDLCSIGNPLCDTYPPPEAGCGGYTTVFCGFGGNPACGAAACATLAPVVNGGWSIPDGITWNNTCSVNCGPGTKTRTCNNPTPANGGSECKRDDGSYTTPSDRTETESCNLGACPTCNPGDTISCDAKYCSSNSAVCATGVYDCLADGSGYNTTCSVVTGNDHCATQCNGGSTSCGTSCTYAQDGACYSGNCLDGSQNCSANVNCGYVSGCSSGTQVSCGDPPPIPTFSKL